MTASNYYLETKQVWRVNPDGEIRDTYGKLKYVFEMEELEFFSSFSKEKKSRLEFYEKCRVEVDQAANKLQERTDYLPFSNAWAASQTAHRLPINSVIHFGIQNSLRFWNYFEIPSSVLGYCNTGGFGIDGNISATIGAALANKEKIFYCVLGDLAFFYDMNSLGNRHISNNVRILLVNNGKGTEFKLKGNPGYLFGEEADKFIAAAGHYGNKSAALVKHYSEDLGFEYLSAATKDEYISVVGRFVSPMLTERPMLLEIFTESSDENAALMFIRSLIEDEAVVATERAKQGIKSILGEKNTKRLKGILGKS